MARVDPTDKQWLRLETVLPPLPLMGRRPRDRRHVFNGIWWLVVTGAPWRDMPDRYGPWETVGGPSGVAQTDRPEPAARGVAGHGGGALTRETYPMPWPLAGVGGRELLAPAVDAGLTHRRFSCGGRMPDHG